MGMPWTPPEISNCIDGVVNLLYSHICFVHLQSPVGQGCPLPDATSSSISYMRLTGFFRLLSYSCFQSGTIVSWVRILVQGRIYRILLN